MNTVISASRRTELVAHYPDYLVHRLEQVGPERVYTLVVWTKDPTNLLTHTRLSDMVRRVGQLFLHWTVTGLGGTFVEPNVPLPQSQLALLDDIVALVGDPRRIHWRYDPLVSARQDDERASNVDLDLFRSLAEPFARAGVPAVHTSFATIYRKVVRRIAQTGMEFEGYSAEERRRFISALAEEAGRLDMQLITCCEPGFPMQRCIDGELLAALHPDREPCPTDRARGQRGLCGCTVSLDIGRYLPCPNRCLYCYAHPVG
ncbi:MAG: DUF1848 family protein [Armatimonadota bacterium]